MPEIGVVETDADMLEHADRDDAVEVAGGLAVVLDAELDAVLKAPLDRPAVRYRELLFGQGDPDHVGAAVSAR